MCPIRLDVSKYNFERFFQSQRYILKPKFWHKQFLFSTSLCWILIRHTSAGCPPPSPLWRTTTAGTCFETEDLKPGRLSRLTLCLNFQTDECDKALLWCLLDACFATKVTLWNHKRNSASLQVKIKENEIQITFLGQLSTKKSSLTLCDMPEPPFRVGVGVRVLLAEAFGVLAVLVPGVAGVAWREYDAW